jgi:hypothetical protein
MVGLRGMSARLNGCYGVWVRLGWRRWDTYSLVAGLGRAGDRVARDVNVMRVTGTGAIRASSSVREALPKEEP